MSTPTADYVVGPWRGQRFVKVYEAHRVTFERMCYNHLVPTIQNTLYGTGLVLVIWTYGRSRKMAKPSSAKTPRPSRM